MPAHQDSNAQAKANAAKASTIAKAKQNTRSNSVGAANANATSNNNVIQTANKLASETLDKIDRAEGELWKLGDDFFPMAIVETVQKPSYNKKNKWDITVVTDEKDVMIRFYLIMSKK